MLRTIHCTILVLTTHHSSSQGTTGCWMTMEDINVIVCIMIQSYNGLINPDFFQRQRDIKEFPSFMGCLKALIFDALFLDPSVYPITSKEHRNSIQRECHDLYGKSPALSPARFWKALRAEIMSSWPSNFDAAYWEGVPQKWCTGCGILRTAAIFTDFTKSYKLRSTPSTGRKWSLAAVTGCVTAGGT